MNFYEIKISLILKSSIHFQEAPEAVSKMISTALIKSGYEEHYKNAPKNYVFSNLGKANEKGYFEKKAEVIFRSFDEKLANKLINSLFLYEDNIFKVSGIKFDDVKYKKIKYLLTFNPVFIVMKDGRFWTFQKSGNLNTLLEALQSNVIRKYEMVFNEKISPKENFIEYFQIKNDKPQTFFYKGAKFFGYKYYIVPRDDEISQKLAFVAIGCGLGHKNSSVGGGFLKWGKENNAV